MPAQIHVVIKANVGHAKTIIVALNCEMWNRSISLVQCSPNCNYSKSSKSPEQWKINIWAITFSSESLLIRTVCTLGSRYYYKYLKLITHALMYRLMEETHGDVNWLLVRPHWSRHTWPLTPFPTSGRIHTYTPSITHTHCQHCIKHCGIVLTPVTNCIVGTVVVLTENNYPHENIFSDVNMQLL